MTTMIISSNEKALPLTRTIVKAEGARHYGSRYGTPVEKGIIVTENKLINREEELKRKLTFYTAYPDRWLEECFIPAESNFKILYYQRVFMRSLMRYEHIHITAARGISKTFTSILTFMLKASIQPGVQLAISAPTKSQAASVSNQKVNEILNRFPLLKNEIKSHTQGKDYLTLIYKNGSTIEVVAPLESIRGRRFSGLTQDELRDADGEAVNSILIPTLAISRTTAGRQLTNPYEPKQCQIFTTSASSKSSYNYEKLLEIFQESIVSPRKSFVIGMDFRVATLEGLISKDYIQQMRLSQTFSEETFAREWLSIYSAQDDDSWFNFTQLNRHRKIINAEWSEKIQKGLDQFYLLSVDVGRLHDQTVVTVFKVTVNHNKYKATIVNIFVLGRTPETRPFSVQVRDLKCIIRDFKPREVVIDINGLGIGIADEIIRPHWDDQGILLEPLGFSNNDDYKKIQPIDAPKILYGIKATNILNSQMFGNCYSRINAGVVDFLIKEQEARGKLLATKKGQKMSIEQKVKRLMPYEMTTKLFEEMGNLRLKRTGSGLDIVLEQINTRYPKDKFSSLIMGLWRIKELEELAIKKSKRCVGGRKLTFYTGG